MTFGTFKRWREHQKSSRPSGSGVLRAPWERKASTPTLRAATGTWVRLRMVSHSVRCRFATMCRHLGKCYPYDGASWALIPPFRRAELPQISPSRRIMRYGHHCEYAYYRQLRSLHSLSAGVFRLNSSYSGKWFTLAIFWQVEYHRRQGWHCILPACIHSF